MKKLVTLLFLLVSTLGFGQSVIAPDAKSFVLNTANQDASGFVLSGFGSTATLLCAIGLPQAPAGTTFNMTRFDGLTPASGFNFSGNKTRLVFTGTMANINIALATLRINTTATAGNIQISVSATVNPTGYFYNPSNGHFYRPISTGTTYSNAKSLASQQTFKGQQGYLVTITSADEDAFIFSNVPQNQIWFALTDEVVEGQWRIDAGPENGTLIKTSNGQTAGNIVGQYNNWAGGEPNNAGNEDYAVTKWNGSQWNDLPNHFNCPYVIEFGTWTNPDDQTFTEFVSNSVNHSNGNVLRTEFNFNFGNNVDETMFRTRIVTSNDNLTFSSNNSFVNLNGLGRVNMTSQIDVQQIGGSGIKANTTGGQVEWCVVYDYEPSNQRYQILIDKREFEGTGVSPNSVTNLKLFDLWDGPVTYQWDDGTWAAYWIYTSTELNFAGSSFSANIRRASFFWALQAEFTFGQNMINKFHKLEFGSLNATQNASLLGSIVTVSDVYLAFREFADRGIMGDESKYFSSGIQFDNADVNEDNLFDERDCYLLLTHLQGISSLWSTTPNIGDAMKLIPSTNYDGITKQNWNTVGNLIKTDYPFTFTNGILNSYNLDVSWKGDVNLSHSSLPQGYVQINSIGSVKTMNSEATTNSVSKGVESDIMMEMVEDNVVATIKLNTNGNKIGATQFNVYFDNTILDYVKTEFTNNTNTNFARNNGKFITLGTLNTSGGSIADVEYKVIFKPKTSIKDILGLITIENIETLDTTFKKLLVKII